MLEDDADPLAERPVARLGSNPSTVTSPPSRRGTPRVPRSSSSCRRRSAEQAEHLAFGDRERDPADRLLPAVRLPQASDVDRCHVRLSTAKTPPGGKRGSGPPLSAAADLPAVRLVTDDDDHLAAPGRDRTHRVGVGTGSEALVGLRLDADRTADLVRGLAGGRSGLDRIASGRIPSAANCLPSPRACSRPPRSRVGLVG